MSEKSWADIVSDEENSDQTSTEGKNSDPKQHKMNQSFPKKSQSFQKKPQSFQKKPQSFQKKSQSFQKKPQSFQESQSCQKKYVILQKTNWTQDKKDTPEEVYIMKNIANADLIKNSAQLEDQNKQLIKENQQLKQQLKKYNSVDAIEFRTFNWDKEAWVVMNIYNILTLHSILMTPRLVNFDKERGSRPNGEWYIAYIKGGKCPPQGDKIIYRFL